MKYTIFDFYNEKLKEAQEECRKDSSKKIPVDLELIDSEFETIHRNALFINEIFDKISKESKKKRVNLKNIQNYLSDIKSYYTFYVRKFLQYCALHADDKDLDFFDIFYEFKNFVENKMGDIQASIYMQNRGVNLYGESESIG